MDQLRCGCVFRSKLLRSIFVDSFASRFFFLVLPPPFAFNRGKLRLSAIAELQKKDIHFRMFGLSSPKNGREVRFHGPMPADPTPHPLERNGADGETERSKNFQLLHSLFVAIKRFCGWKSAKRAFRSPSVRSVENLGKNQKLKPS